MATEMQTPNAEEIIEQDNEVKEEKKPEPKKRKRRFGDRREGRMLRSLDGIHMAMPFIMKDRCDACNQFAEEIEIGRADEIVREEMQSGKENFSMLHIILAAYVRTIAAYPYLNRFVSGQRIYARNNIEVVMTVKKEMTMSAPETCIKVVFDPHDTLNDVYEKFNAAVTNIENTAADGVAGFFRKFPRLPFRWTIAIIKNLDYWGICPKALIDSLPFWGSMIITSMGSLGIRPVYHHIYDFGNLPVFMSYGKKYSKNVLKADGTVEKRNFISFRVVTDERICDGYYYASAFKMISRYLQHPEQLDVPPKEIVEDID